jgi:hypothetical protein
VHVIGAHLRAADSFISSKSEGLNLGITILRRLRREDGQDLASVGYARYILRFEMRQDLGGVVIAGSFRERRDLPRAFELTHHKHHHITNAKHKNLSRYLHCCC